MGEMTRFVLNDQLIDTDVSKGIPLLDFIRRDEGLTGSKEGCREGECGACTVLVGELLDGGLKYRAVAACLFPLGEAAGKHVITVEGVNQKELNPIQQAFIDEGATQCGFCTPGFIMSLTGFFINSPELSYEDALDAVDGNICRCTGYVSIRKAIHNLCEEFAAKLEPKKDRIKQLVVWNILPESALQVSKSLETLQTEVPVLGKRKEGSVLVAGATDLLVQRPEELMSKELHFLSEHKDLCGISEKDGKVHIGGCTNVADMKRDPVIQKYFPLIREKLNRISSTIMRNRATVAGNIANASPIADLAIMFIALKASIVLRDRDRNRRTIMLKDFFKGYKQLDLQKGEIIEEFFFYAPKKEHYFDFDKVSQRRYLDIASCNSAIAFKYNGKILSDVCIAAGGVAAIPFTLQKCAAFLEGKELSSKVVKEAADIALSEIKPISDIRGSAEYKSLLLRQLIFGHFIKLFPKKIQFEELVK